MISPKFFIDSLIQNDIDFFSGVPDSLLSNICAYISDIIDEKHNIIAANEGGAIGLAAGYYLASSKIGCVYMQNSGEGNAINPLVSLTDKDVYNIPVLLLIGWRGRPDVHDEPQHAKQGKITLGLLNAMGIDYTILSKDENVASMQINKAVAHMKATNEVYAIIIEKDTFKPYTRFNLKNNKYSLAREDAIQEVASVIDRNDIVVSTTGMISRELFEFRTKMEDSHERDFLTVGSMGHANQIALGMSMEISNRRIWCFDGDGALLMHLGGMAIIASKKPKNYYHVVFNNGAHDSVGGQPTVGLLIDLPSVAKAVGYKKVYSVDNKADLNKVLTEIKEIEGPVFIEIKVKRGSRKDLGRPTVSPIQSKKALMDFIGG